MDSQYSPAEIAAIVDEARGAGLRWPRMPMAGPASRLAVAAGIHSIEHGRCCGREHLAAMAEHELWLVLTTTILFHPDGIEHGDGARPDDHGQGPGRPARSRAERPSACGRAGSGSPSAPTRCTACSGTSSAGWSSTAGASGQADRRHDDRGAAVLERDDCRGAAARLPRADFVVLRRDPLADITAVRDVAAVYQDGRHVAWLAPAPTRRSTASEAA